jgi:hypothetical protein
VSFPIKNGGSFHSYVKLPEGKLGPELYVFFLPNTPDFFMTDLDPKSSNLHDWNVGTLKGFHYLTWRGLFFLAAKQSPTHSEGE